MNKRADGMRSRAYHGQYFISTRHLPFAAILTVTESCEVSRRQERASSKRFPIMSLRSLTTRNFRQATDLPASCLPSRIAHDRASAKNGLRAKITNYNPHTQIKKHPDPNTEHAASPRRQIPNPARRGLAVIIVVTCRRCCKTIFSGQNLLKIVGTHGRCCLIKSVNIGGYPTGYRFSNNRVHRSIAKVCPVG